MVKEKKQPAPKKKGEITQSETVIIKRSQISFAPYNPKRHSEDGIKTQLSNFKNVGFLGGIVWNESTGNIVSGHKRIMAMDLHYGYDGTPATDYNVKVEKVSLTDKQEKEQNIFMDARGTNTQQDYEMIALILPGIDYKMTGLSTNELNLITVESPLIDITPAQIIKEDFKELNKDLETKKNDIKEAKKKIRDQLVENPGECTVTLSFDTTENKQEFMERFGFTPTLRFIKGEVFSDMIERVE